MSPLAPDGLYDQLRKAYKECLKKGWLDAAELLKKEFTKIQSTFLKTTMPNKEKPNVEDLEESSGC